MIELVRTNDAVIISFICALLKDAGIEHFVADTNMSIFEGSLGIIPHGSWLTGTVRRRRGGW